MSDNKNKPEGLSSEKATDGRTSVTTVEEAAPKGDTTQGAELTPEEEKVIRMRYGRSLKENEGLEFSSGASMETKLKLALIEANLLEAFEAEALDPDPHTGAPRSVIADSIE